MAQQLTDVIETVNTSVNITNPTGNWTEHHAAVIEFADGSSTILLLTIHTVTSRPVPFEEAEAAVHTSNQGKLPSKCSYPWDAFTRPELQTKFKNMPMMNISDITFLVPPLTRQSVSGADRETFYPQAYSNTWLWKPNLQENEYIMPPLYGSAIDRRDRDSGEVWHGCARVSTAKSIGDPAFDDGSRVTWKHKPTKPFAMVALDDFTCAPRMKPLVPEIEDVVDGLKTCRVYYECISPEWNNSGMCKTHRDRTATMAIAGRPLSARALPAAEDPKEIKYSGVFESFTPRSPKKKIWAIDFEGFCMALFGFAQIPISFGIVNLETDESASGPIKYNYANIDDMAYAMIKSGGMLPQHQSFRRIRGCLFRHYGGTQVVGRTLAEWKAKLLSMGFNEETDMVVNWGTTNFDRLSLGRIMAVENRFSAKAIDIEPKTLDLDIMSVFRYHSTISQFSLGHVYRTFIDNDHEYRWHDALYDAKATRSLWFVAKRYTTEMFKEMQKDYRYNQVSLKRTIRS